MCFEVCPYEAPQFGIEENPKMQKCNLCVDRWAEGKPPICVAACPTRALDAGPMEEMTSRYGSMYEAEGFVYDDKIKPAAVFKPKREPMPLHGGSKQ
jgi:anaerobic dimethyl sulfoxide reductase subunit B (iron-sulfur subunit)